MSGRMLQACEEDVGQPSGQGVKGNSSTACTVAVWSWQFKTTQGISGVHSQMMQQSDGFDAEGQPLLQAPVSAAHLVTCATLACQESRAMASCALVWFEATGLLQEQSA